MSQLKNYLNNLYEKKGLLSSHDRRIALIKEMQLLEGKTIHCFTCPGTCCTSQANSMQITPIEALEILESLHIDQFTPTQMSNFKEKMNQTIAAYRLNFETYTGKKHTSVLRKSYTCPFFNNGSLGCGLSRSSKPYGCLGFNPKTSDDNGKSCSSNIEREESFHSNEDLVNAHVKLELNLHWTKQNIPLALLDIINRIYT